MRPGPNNRRMRGRGNNNRRGPSKNPNYDSSGPESKVRGNAQQLVDKYLQLSRDALTSGDPVTAENFLQHAEHYHRVHSAANEQRNEQRPAGRAQGQGQNHNGNGSGNAADGKNGTASASSNEASGKAGNGKDVDVAEAPQPDIGTRAESGEPKTA